MDVADLDQSGLFGDKEDITFEKEEIALNGFEVGFESWASVSVRRGYLYIFLPEERGQTFGSFLNQRSSCQPMLGKRWIRLRMSDLRKSSSTCHI